jgi:purine-binding chemotaxis protein CheW
MAEDINQIPGEHPRNPTRESPAKASTDGLEVLEFNFGYERYGIEAGFVGEVAVLKSLTPVPCTPEFVAGIINLHGRILSVIDIKKFFGLFEHGLAELSRAVVIRNATMEFALLADSIVGLRRIPEQDIHPGLSTSSAIRKEFLKGITGDRMAILDGHRLLTDKSLIVHEEIL